MDTLNRMIRHVNTACGLASEAIVFLLMLMVTAEIISRHVFNSPIPGQVETATLSLTVILYLGLAFTQDKRAHIRVEIFIGRIRGRKRELMEALGLLLCLVPSVLMFLATAAQARLSVEGGEYVTGIINFPVWPGRCAVAFGLGLLSITIALQVCGHIIAAIRGEKAAKVY